jgi:hypothetical protein
MGDANKMNRRSNDTLYFTEEIMQKVLEKRPLKAWDFANLFFPKTTNEKQFDCSYKFLSELDKQGEMGNTEVRHIMESPTDQVMLMSHVIPKLQRFGLIESDGGDGSKKYNLRFARKFPHLLWGLQMDWLVFYARHSNERKQLEGNTD